MKRFFYLYCFIILLFIINILILLDINTVENNKNLPASTNNNIWINYNNINYTSDSYLSEQIIPLKPSTLPSNQNQNITIEPESITNIFQKTTNRKEMSEEDRIKYLIELGEKGFISEGKLMINESDFNEIYNKYSLKNCINC